MCKKEFSDMLKHFVFAHDVRDMNHLAELIEETEADKKRKLEFRNYVQELKNKMEKGIISPNDYRDLIINWCKIHGKEV